MQFQVQAGTPGKKTSGASNWRRKGREGRYAEPMQFQVQAGAPGKKTSGASNWEKDERGVMQSLCSFKCKQGLQGKKKRHGRQIDGEKDERCAMQFQVQAGAPGKKTSGAPNWRRKGQEGRHAVSSASRGSREENVRGAKLTEKRTREAPCSFKCKHGRQWKKKTSGAPNWRRKGQEGHHAVSSASRGSREENVRGAKLTEKRTRDAPCSFKISKGTFF